MRCIFGPCHCTLNKHEAVIPQHLSQSVTAFNSLSLRTKRAYIPISNLLLGYHRLCLFQTLHYLFISLLIVWRVAVLKKLTGRA